MMFDYDGTRLLVGLGGVEKYYAWIDGYDLRLRGPGLALYDISARKIRARRTCD
jgi:hypothetical protein